jgi:hypothetical protein
MPPPPKPDLPEEPSRSAGRYLWRVVIIVLILCIVVVVLLLPVLTSIPRHRPRSLPARQMKNIILALHDHHDTHRSFPSPYSVDSEGRPLLSWRVQILPFLEQKELYEKFNLDEPWYSPNNRKLIPLMPPCFANPKSRLAKEGRTHYLAVCGPGAAFAEGKKLRFGDFRDGSTNVIMVVEAGHDRAVVWTKPEDFDHDPDYPIAGLTDLHQGIFLVGFADGAVRFVPQDIPKAVINALFTRSGGDNALAAEFFEPH